MSPKTNSSKESNVVTRPVNFVADVHLIQILGEQLIGSEKVGILELIKNAYDAKASTCDVWIEKVPGMPIAEFSDTAIANLPGPVITIIDNGRGMNEDTIIKGWLRPATRLKTSIKERLKQERKEADIRGTRTEYEMLVYELKREHDGRLPLGEKGVGRFATHRLGKHLILQTKTADDPLEWVLNIDWDEFDKPGDDPTNNPKALADVSLTLFHRLPQRDYGETNSGTVLRIYGGREGFNWTSEKLLEIGQAISFLQSPSKILHKEKKVKNNEDNPQDFGFEAYFHCPQLGSEKFEILTETVPAPFVCTAIVDENGKAEIEIKFTPPSSLKKPLSSEIEYDETAELRVPPDESKEYWLLQEGKRRLRRPECGPFTCEIKVWIRDGEWIDFTDRRAFLRFLDSYGGVGIYRDSLSIVPPQITSKDDWLGLSTRHIKKGSNISYYMMSGSVDLLQENTLYLIDRTSREGLLDTRPFTDLRYLLREIIFRVERAVINKREQYARLIEGERIPRATINKQVKIATNILENIATSYDFKTDQFNLKSIIGESDDPKKAVIAVGKVFDQVRREVKDLEDQSDALLEVAGYGIAIGVAVHEIEKITTNLYLGLEKVLKSASTLKPETYRQLDDLHQTAGALLNELRRIAPLRVTRLERPRKFLIRDSILAASGAFRLSWNELDINFIQPAKGENFEFTGSFGACSQVFANLFDNSTYWLRTVDTNRRVIAQIDPTNRRIVVADSGPNIDEKFRPHLFKPFYSLKNPPSGLGLYICSYYMHQMRGVIREAYDNERLSGFNGAQFTLIFPKEEIKE